jgi:hypothetical protein
MSAPPILVSRCIRAPARAQDLVLRHRVIGYRAGDLERQYPQLGVHEDFFINYGFVTDRVYRLMHPRRGQAPWSVTRGRHVKRLLDFIRTRGPVHPREVDEHFALGTVTNYWGVRDGKDWTTPFVPTAQGKVMLANRWSGSGGDCFPWLFQKHKMGPVVGTRTWGGLIGMTGCPQLVDGGSVTVPPTLNTSMRP